MKILFLWPVLMSFLLSTPMAKAEPMLTAYFIPLEVDTYTAITPDNIKCMAWEKWTISDATRASIFIELLAGEESDKFDDQLVRMQINTNGKLYYIDQTGAVLIGRTVHQLNPDAISDFRYSLTPAEVINIKKKNKCQ